MLPHKWSLLASLREERLWVSSDLKTAVIMTALTTVDLLLLYRLPTALKKGFFSTPLFIFIVSEV